MSGRNRRSLPVVYLPVVLLTRFALVSTMLVASGCGGDTSQGSADCAQQIEHQGVTYTERGFTELEPVEFKRVVDVPCADTGVQPDPDAPPGYRPSFRFAEHDPSKVLAVAVAVEDGLYRVMLSESLTRSRASSILQSVGAG